MRGMGITFQVDVNKDELINILKTNRANHVAMYEEARQGFIEKAKERLGFELERVSRMKGQKTIRLNIEAPVNHSGEYDTAIKMLELHQGETVSMHADEVRMLVEDEWAWMRTWLVSNSGYSTSAREYAASKYEAAGLFDED